MATDGAMRWTEMVRMFEVSLTTIKCYLQRRRTGSLVASPRLGKGSVRVAALRVGLVLQLEARPALCPGQKTVPHKVATYHARRVRALIEARGAAFWFLTAYAPDLIPTEEVFSSVKVCLRRAAARNADTLTRAFRDALRAVARSTGAAGSTIAIVP